MPQLHTLYELGMRLGASHTVYRLKIALYRGIKSLGLQWQPFDPLLNCVVPSSGQNILAVRIRGSSGLCLEQAVEHAFRLGMANFEYTFPYPINRPKISPSQ